MPPDADLIPLLSRTPLFRNCSQDELGTLLGAGKIRRLEESSFYFHQGDPASHFYVLTGGHARLSQVTENGQHVILRFISAGQMFGAIGLINPDATYPVSAQSVDDSQAVTWDNATFNGLRERMPGISLDLAGSMALHIQEMQTRYRELSTERTEQRLAQTLLRLAAQFGRKVDQGVLVDMALSRQSLAEMTGMTLYTVSRLFSKWERRGLLETGREKVVILRPHDLVEIADALQK